MKKVLYALGGSGALFLLTAVTASQALAQTDTTLTPEEASKVTTAAAGGLMGLFAAGIAIAAIAGIIGLIFLILWIWALVDVLGRKFPNEGTKKTWMWLVILSWPLPIVMGFIPAINVLSPVVGIAGAIIVIVYLVSIRKQGTKGTETAKPPTA